MVSSSRLRRSGGDLLVVALAIGAQIELWVTPLDGPRAAMAFFCLLWTLPLLARRRFPLIAPGTVFVAVASETFFAPGAIDGGIVSLGVAVTAGFMIGFWNERRQAVAGAILIWVAVMVINRNVGSEGAADIVFSFVLAGLTVGTGQLLRAHEARTEELRGRTLRLRAEREERARAAVGEERARIARELHDVVAHSISVMTIQAGAARLLLDGDPARAEQPLLSIEDTGRETLTELRRLLGVLRRDMSEDELDPRPALASLNRLVASVRESGLTASLTVEGEARELPPGLELTAYRIVQEALTNVRKHAGPARASVTVRYERRLLELLIENDASPSGSNGAAPSGGHGLVGMRERAAMYGGTLEAVPLPGGGFRVLARLPIETAE